MNIQLPIRNFPQQQQIFDSPARIVTIVKGRRFGFTKGAANNTIMTALKGKKKHGLWVDTINSNIEKYFERYFIPTLRKIPADKWSWRKQQKIFTLGNFYMDFRSADTPENIEGFDYDYVILNEAGIILKNEYLWDNAIKPMTWVDDCNIYIGGTPKGGGGEFEKLYRRGLDASQSQFASFHFNSFDNPFLPKAVVLEDMKTMPQRVVDQEIYAHFLEDTGIVFRGVEAISVLEPKEPEFDHRYIIGCDLAKLEDFTVMAIYDTTTNEQVCQVRFTNLEWTTIKYRIITFSRRYNNAMVVLDSTGVGEPIYDDLSQARIPVEGIHFTNELKKQLIEKLATWVEMRNLKMLRLDETMNEFRMFTYDMSEKTGRVIYGAPSGFHDDIVIAHALACWRLYPKIAKTPVREMEVIERDLYLKAHPEPDDLEERQDYEYEPVNI